MDNRKFNILLFVIGMLIYAINTYIRIRTGIYFIDTILDNHFNDYIGGCIFVAYINIVLSYSKYSLLNKWWHYLIIFIVCSFTWEIITPLIKKDSVCDIFDIVAYGIGVLTYIFLNKIKNHIKLSVNNKIML